MHSFMKLFIDRAGELLEDFQVFTGELDSSRLLQIGEWGRLHELGGSYYDDDFLTDNELFILQEGSKLLYPGAPPPAIDEEKLGFFRTWAEATQLDRDIGLGIYCCIRLIGHFYRNDDEAVVLFRIAAERYAFAISGFIKDDPAGAKRDERLEFAKLGAAAKLKNDPKQAEKKFIQQCWQEWQSQPAKYKGKAAFARDMLLKCEHIESTKTIENWVTGWRKNTTSAGTMGIEPAG